MKNYYVTVNGNRYEVQVEEVKGDFQPSEQVSITTEETKVASKLEVKQQPEAVKKPASAPTVAKAAEGEKISSPMPGTILEVNIKAGDIIKKGDVIFVLEAMKMENEIMASRDAKVVQVNVNKGASVNTGEILAVIQ